MSEIDAGIVEKVWRAMEATFHAPKDELMHGCFYDGPSEDGSCNIRGYVDLDELARAAIAAYEEAKAEDRAAHVAGLSSVINAVHGEALQELAIETVDASAAKTVKSHPILDAIKASAPNLSEWTITSGATGTLFFDTHGGIITQAEKQSIRDAILGQLPSTPPVNVFFKDDI